MRRNLAHGKVGIDFLDGFIHSTMNELLITEGVDSSGLYGFYAARISGRLGGILEYEEGLARYVLEHCSNRRIVEVGTGLGELPIMLALNGLVAAGLEYEHRRFQAAAAIRMRLVNCFPEIVERYELINGAYPEALANTAWIGSDVTLLFTNVGAGWDCDRADRAIKFFPRVGEVILELRTFGIVRESEADRNGLFNRIAAGALSSERLPDLSPGAHFARFTFYQS
ncbi:MAG: hypothetical protein ACREFC_10235 [Stellaceae bacterium]